MEGAMKHLLAIAANILLLAVPVYSQSAGPSRNAATLTEQKMCAEAAKSYFRDYNTDGLTFSVYTNHYNAQLKKCFIKVKTEYKKSDGFFRITQVIDVFENVTYGHFFENPNGIICWILNRTSQA